MVAIPNTTYTITSQLCEGQISNPNAVVKSSCFFSIQHLKLPQVILLWQVVLSDNAEQVFKGKLDEALSSLA